MNIEHFRSRWLKPAIVAIIAAGLLWHASQLAPTGPAAGPAASVDGESFSTLADQSDGQPRRLRLGTFNIHGCKGTDGRRDVERVAECLTGLDFVALNEVHGRRPWQALDQAGELGRRSRMNSLFAPSVRTWYCLESGNGLLSRLPVIAWQRIPLPGRYARGHRNAVLAQLHIEEQAVHVLLTHLTRNPQDRPEQLRTVIALYRSLAEPAVLLGDLNSDADDPQLRDLLASPGIHDPVGEVLGREAPRRIDWIITRGLRTVDAGLRDDGASDHPLMWAEVEVGPACRAGPDGSRPADGTYFR